MISVEQARKLITKNSKALSFSLIDVGDSMSKTLSKNIIAPVFLPPFNQSAMDGYAFKFSDYQQNKKITIVGEIAAGKFFSKKLSSGEAVRIFTGAPVPSGADTVVMQEKTSTEKNTLLINDLALKCGGNIRMVGSQIKKGKTALTKGALINPGTIGYLTAMGVTKVNVISSPKITIIVTGSELKKPGKKLSKGQIYESNSYAVEAALNSIYLTSYKIISVTDNETQIYNIIKKAIATSDMVLITGGISVGDYDFTGKTLNKLGVKNIFYKIKQKPGKPLFFGKHDKTIVFGLPGNPAAVLSCFYEYVHPAIRIMQGRKDIFLKKIMLPIAKDYAKKKGLSFFLKGKITDNNVIPLDGQESYILSSFAMADCIIYCAEETENIKKGDLVEVHLLPQV